MLDVDIANAEAKRISCAVVDGIMDEEKGRVDVGSLVYQLIISPNFLPRYPLQVREDVALSVWEYTQRTGEATVFDFQKCADGKVGSFHRWVSLYANYALSRSYSRQRSVSCSPDDLAQIANDGEMEQSSEIDHGLRINQIAASKARSKLVDAAWVVHLLGVPVPLGIPECRAEYKSCRSYYHQIKRNPRQARSIFDQLTSDPTVCGVIFRNWSDDDFAATEDFGYRQLACVLMLALSSSPIVSKAMSAIRTNIEPQRLEKTHGVLLTY